MLEALLAELSRTPEEALDNAVRLRKQIYDSWWQYEEDLNALPDDPMFSLVREIRKRQDDAAGSYFWPGA